MDFNDNNTFFIEVPVSEFASFTPNEYIECKNSYMIFHNNNYNLQSLFTLNLIDRSELENECNFKDKICLYLDDNESF